MLNFTTGHLTWSKISQVTPVSRQKLIVTSNTDLSSHFWMLPPTPEILLTKSNVSSHWLKEGLQGWGRICQMFCYFDRNSWQGKENGSKQNKVSPLYMYVFFLAAIAPSCPCYANTSFHACGLYFTVSQYYLCLHHCIPYVQVVSSKIQSI